jgi:hypothetical protein
MKLTGTNSSIGLIVLMINVRTLTNCEQRRRRLVHLNQGKTPNASYKTTKSFLLANILCRPGGLSEKPEPDPIPNSAVKLLSADGTVSQDPGE